MKKEESMEPKKSSSGSKAGSRASSNSGTAVNSKGTYPKPKNFAERMMNALENDVDPNIISWLKSNNDDLVAINLKALKNSNVLETYFQGVRYAAFARNLSRWYVKMID